MIDDPLALAASVRLSKPAVIQLVTGLPPEVDGVGDYATCLAVRLDQLGWRSSFVVGNPAYVAPPSDTLIVSSRVPDRTPDALLRTLESIDSDTLLLHFSGYGYASRGLCFWICDGLVRWKAAKSQRRVITMFHELYANGPPWRSAFWTCLPQRHIAHALSKLSDHALAGYEFVAKRMRAWRRSDVRVVPVFSNVGETKLPLALGERPAHAVVFGSPRWRERVYRHLNLALPMLRDAGIRRIIDIGKPLRDMPALHGFSVDTTGLLPAAQIADVMHDARVGLANYPRHMLARSGILAAYHAHGLLCVNLARARAPLDAIVEGRHFIGRESLTGEMPDGQFVASSGHAWYQDHDIAATADVYAGLLRNSL